MEYNYIVNPKTNRKCRVDSVQGKKILNNYVQNAGSFLGYHKPCHMFKEQHKKQLCGRKEICRNLARSDWKKLSVEQCTERFTNKKNEILKLIKNANNIISSGEHKIKIEKWDGNLDNQFKRIESSQKLNEMFADWNGMRYYCRMDYLGAFISRIKREIMDLEGAGFKVKNMYYSGFYDTMTILNNEHDKLEKRMENITLNGRYFSLVSLYEDIFTGYYNIGHYSKRLDEHKRSVDKVLQKLGLNSVGELFEYAKTKVSEKKGKTVLGDETCNPLVNLRNLLKDYIKTANKIKPILESKSYQKLFIDENGNILEDDLSNEDFEINIKQYRGGVGGNYDCDVRPLREVTIIKVKEVRQKLADALHRISESEMKDIHHIYDSLEFLKKYKIDYC